MSKIASDDLFELIKSLNKTEKRYFKVFASKHIIEGENYYTKLFDAIDKQQEYDEKKILEKEKYIKHLPELKSNLYKIVLKSLRSYHSSSSISIQLKSYLHDIEILFEKDLYAQCEKIINKAKQLAVKYDLQLPLLELLGWEMIMIRNRSYIGVTEDKLKQHYNRIFEITKQYNTDSEYILLADSLFLKMIREGDFRGSEDVMKLCDEPLFNVKEKDLSYKSLSHFYVVHEAYYFARNDYENAYLYQQKLVHLMDSNPHQIAENQMQYIGRLHNLFTCQIYLKKYHECAEVIDKLSKLQVKSMAVKSHWDFITNYMKLSLCIHTGAFNEGLQLIKLKEDKWNNNESATKGRVLYFQYSAAYIYFVTGNYSMANNYLNTLMNNIVDTGSDIYCFAQILSLLVYFEMGKLDLLEYKVKSVHRFLYKRKKLYKVETIILDFIQKELPKIYSDKELIPAFKNLKKEIEEVIKIPFEQKALEYFDLISWLESKIEGRAFAKVVREKAIKI